MELYLDTGDLGEVEQALALGVLVISLMQARFTGAWRGSEE